MITLPHAFKLTSGDDVTVDADTTAKNLIHFRISRLDDTSDKFSYNLQEGDKASNSSLASGPYTEEQAEAINIFLKKNNS